MDQKTQFIADYLRRNFSISELCTQFGISRKTGYKWIDRYLHDGPQGLEDLSRAPYTSPHRTPPHVEAALIELRTHHPGRQEAAVGARTPPSQLAVAGPIDHLRDPQATRHGGQAPPATRHRPSG
jgi:transposase-like protein